MQVHDHDNEATDEEVADFVEVLEAGFGIDINEICRRVAEEYVSKKRYDWTPKT
jgi:hypothetical protein